MFEATGIIEYLEAAYPHSRRLIPLEPLASADVRMWDRFFDNYVNYPQQRLVYIARLTANMMMAATAGERCSIQPMRFWIGTWLGASGLPAMSSVWLIALRLPPLLYADWTYAIAEEFTNVRNYRRRLLARPSYARALDEARPFRHLFPLGAPEEGRD